jgi:uncharacterized protein YndB with AHSA1/START domain
MTERSVEHATFTIERKYPASPSRVFDAWARPEAKAKWFGEPGNGEQPSRTFDFRVDGRERLEGSHSDGSTFVYNAVYRDIVPGERIVFAYDMHMDGLHISVSLATVQFHPDGDGTRLVFTEQGAFLDGYDDAGQREAGTRELLDALGAALSEAA